MKKPFGMNYLFFPLTVCTTFTVEVFHSFAAAFNAVMQQAAGLKLKLQVVKLFQLLNVSVCGDGFSEEVAKGKALICSGIQLLLRRSGGDPNVVTR